MKRLVSSCANRLTAFALIRFSFFISSVFKLILLFADFDFGIQPSLSLHLSQRYAFEKYQNNH
ncbi:hypothetical protein T06_11283 [Trichinella sp. T6]|nr:hypothetical protein T06_11283 [Trichinella sp. T6]